jgi:hypothetical protein
MKDELMKQKNLNTGLLTEVDLLHRDIWWHGINGWHMC